MAKNYIGYETNLGRCVCGNSLDVLGTLKDGSINLVVTRLNTLTGSVSLLGWSTVSCRMTVALLSILAVPMSTGSRHIVCISSAR